MRQVNVKDLQNKKCCYFLQHDDGGAIKIGYSSNFRNRYKEYAVHNPTVRTIKLIYGGTRKVEKALLAKFKPSRIKGEWFKNTEELHKLIALLPHKATSESQLLDIIKNFKVTEVLTETNDPSLYYKERIKEAHRRLDQCFIHSRNSGYTEGIRSAMKILTDLFEG